MHEEKLIREAVRLEAEIFSDAWSENSIRETASQPHAVIFGEWEGDSLLGYLIFYFVMDEGEIARIAVAPESRRQGAGGRLLRQADAFCAERGIRRMLLDVRESNISAREFYEKHGFSQDGIRKKFYTDPQEDAILMSRKL